MQLDFVPNTRAWLRIFLCLFTDVTWIASAQSVKNEATEVASLRAEMLKLTLELLQHRAEFIQWKMNWIKVELEQIQAERRRVSGERQLIEREIGELNQASTNGPGAEDEGRKQELNTV